MDIGQNGLDDPMPEELAEIRVIIGRYLLLHQSTCADEHGQKRISALAGSGEKVYADRTLALAPRFGYNPVFQAKIRPSINLLFRCQHRRPVTSSCYVVNRYEPLSTVPRSRLCGVLRTRTYVSFVPIFALPY